MSTISLSNALPIDTESPESRQWLSKLQGNIVSGHGRDHGYLVFFELPADETAAQGVVAGVRGLITDADRQARESRRYRRSKITGDPFASLLLSANGYRRLGFAKQLKSAFTPPDSAKDFLEGMSRNSAATFGDPPPAQWEEGYREGSIDALLLVADDDEAFLSRSVGRILDSHLSKCTIRVIERASVLRNAAGLAVEHFGFVDGRSQPLFLSSDFSGQNERVGKDARPVRAWNPFAPLGLALRPDPFAAEENCFGSFMVFRKLRQDVRAFLREEQRLSDLLGLNGADAERAGAMLIGRYRDGTPLELAESRLAGTEVPNDFDYRSDLRGLRCPIHAHIRKANPRGETTTRFGVAPDVERGHRIVRRGMSFGEAAAGPYDPRALSGSEEVGLLFMCFQANIAEQFGFIQRSWCLNNDFAASGTGQDPVLALSAGGAVPPQTWRPVFGQDGQEIRHSFPATVTMRGGEYFFAPSLPFISNPVPRRDATAAGYRPPRRISGEA